jgi:hypothetical protein
MVDTSSLIEVHFALSSKLDGLGMPVEGKMKTITMTHLPREGEGVIPKFDGPNDSIRYVIDRVDWYPTEAALAAHIWLKESRP